MPTFEQIISAEFGFSEIKELIFKIYTHPHIDGILNELRAFLETVPLIPLAVGAALITLIFTFFGKKLIFIPMVIGSYCLAYAGGATFIAPRLANLVGDWFAVDAGTVGIVFGVIAAVFCLPVYFCGIAGASGYLTYLVAYPTAVSLLGDSTGMIAAAAIAVGVIVVVFVFRKWFEMAGTAILGSYLFMLGINSVGLLPKFSNYVIWFAMAVAGFVFQVKTRKRY